MTKTIRCADKTDAMAEAALAFSRGNAIRLENRHALAGKHEVVVTFADLSAERFVWGAK